MNYSSIRMLLCETRRLSYDSSGFFLKEYKKAFQELGVIVEECKLQSDLSNLDQFEKICTRSYDGIIDMNSIIPDMILDDGSYLVDHFQGKFHNYILDHPMHLYPMLALHCKNQQVICLEESHKKWITENISHIEEVTLSPLAVSNTGFIPNKKEYLLRKYDILFPATYQSVEGLKYRIANSSGMKQKCYKDRLFREQKRQRVLADLILHDLDVYVLGANWEDFSLFHHPHFHYLQTSSYERSLKYMQNAKIVVNLQPGFTSAPHDRIFNAYGSGAMICSDSCGFLDKEKDIEKSYLRWDMDDMQTNIKSLKYHLQNPTDKYDYLIQARGYIMQTHNYLKRAENLLQMLFDKH